MITSSTFRASFPAFASLTTYPAEAIDFWLAYALAMLPQRRWGPSSIPEPAPVPIVAPALPLTRFDYGCMLLAAHMVILEKQSNDAASRGGTPGQRVGSVASDSVGPISRSYDTSATLELGAGHWNMTSYGLRFRALAQMVGTGPVTVGGGLGPMGWANWSGNPGAAWAGPPGGLYPWIGSG